MTPEEREKLLSGPAAQAPPGVDHDFSHPEAFEKSGLIVAIVFLVVIFLLFSMRIFVKLRIARELALEDYFLTVAWVLYSGGFTVVAILVARKGVGAHQWNLTIRQLIDYLKTFHAGSILYNVIALALKISIILQMIRFFVPYGVRNFTFWMSHVLIWVNVLFYVTCTFLLIFACKPEAKNYDPTIKGHCLDSAAILISTAVLNTVSDGLMLILPQRVIWDLSMPLKRKMGLSAAFLVALLAFGSSLVRLYFATRLETSHDMSYNIGWLGMWTLPEIAIGFLISCLPFLPKFMKHMARKPMLAKIVDKLAIGFWSSFGKSRLYARHEGRDSDQSTKPARPSRMITDLEFEELVVQTGLSSNGGDEARGHGHVIHHYSSHADTQADPWPPKIERHEAKAAVWTTKNASSETSVDSESAGIVVRTDVSVSRD